MFQPPFHSATATMWRLASHWVCRRRCGSASISLVVLDQPSGTHRSVCVFTRRQVVEWHLLLLLTSLPAEAWMKNDQKWPVKSRREWGRESSLSESLLLNTIIQHSRHLHSLSPSLSLTYVGRVRWSVRCHRQCKRGNDSREGSVGEKFKTQDSDKVSIECELEWCSGGRVGIKTNEY